MTTERPDREAARIKAVLDRVLTLSLPPAQWTRLAGIIEAAIAAEAAADLGGLREAATELELAAPVRIVRIGGELVVPPPPPVRERVEALQSSLQSGGAGTERGQGTPGKDKK
jgi:hypothetical protein